MRRGGRAIVGGSTKVRQHLSVYIFYVFVGVCLEDVVPCLVHQLG
jgi:hypothetical protein